jgi:eukaryotic translation initiation factor 2-alpha kinase 4
MIAFTLAFDASVQLRGAMQSGIPTIAIDVPNLVFESLTKSSSWLTEDEAWKTISSTFGNPIYAQLVREAVLKKRSEGHKFILLFAVREERLQVLQLQ